MRWRRATAALALRAWTSQGSGSTRSSRRSRSPRRAETSSACARLLTQLDALLPGQVTPSIRAFRARFRAYLPEADADAEFRIAERVFGELELPFFLAITRLEAAGRLLGGRS